MSSSSERSNSSLDRISSLPDSVLCHILSFLPTKQSASTTILSKRWNPLWLSVLTLDFNDRDFTNISIFRHFIYSVMLLRDISLPLRSFRLKCNSSPECDSNYINQIVCAVAQRRVENLILDFTGTDYDSQIRLGHSAVSRVFGCRNLVVLKLKKLIVKVFPQFDFPILKTLHLDNVIFAALSDNEFIKLVEGCTILEELLVTDLQFKRPNFQNGEFKCLPKIVGVNISTSYLKTPFAWVCNAKFLSIKLYHQTNVHSFHNLVHMELIFTRFWHRRLTWLLELLQHCPKLQTLTLHELHKNCIVEDDWKEPQIVPKCISSQLRACSLIGYKGTKYELQIAEYILKNAKLLHTMTISASKMDINTKHQILMKLSLCPRASSTCKLSFD